MCLHIRENMGVATIPMPWMMLQAGTVRIAVDNRRPRYQGQYD
jgi:hypothetical protein